MGHRDTARTPSPKTKKRTPKQNKNLRNSQFMPPHPKPPGAGVGKEITEEDFLNIFTKGQYKKKTTTAGTARSLLGTK